MPSRRSLASVCLLALATPCPTGAQSTDTEPARAAPVVELQQPPNRIRRQLAQLDALTAEKQWTEVVELISALLDDPLSRQSVLPVLNDKYGSNGKNVSSDKRAAERYVSLANFCHLKLSQLPPEALRFYRDSVDSAVRQQFQRAVRSRDEVELEEIIDQSFCSSWGDDALLALGDIALERGDFTAARHHWRRISPILSEPTGRPLDWALHGVDVDLHAGQVVERLQNAKPASDWLFYPDTNLDVQRLLARLATASIRQRELDRAAIELRLLRAIAPDATGRLAGRDVVLHDAIAKQLALAVEKWADQSDRAGKVGPLVGRLWPQPFALTQPPPPPVYATRGPVGLPSAPPTELCESVVWRRSVLFRDGPTLRALDLITGEPAITRNGQLHSSPMLLAAPGRRSPALVQRGIFFQPSPRLRMAVPLTESPTLLGDKMYVRLHSDEENSGANRQTQLHLVGRDLARENLTILDIRPPKPPWRFGSPPAVGGGRLYVALVADDVRPRVAVACYSQATGRSLWRTTIGSGQPPVGFLRAASPQPRLTLAASGVYVNTNFGALAKLDRRQGAVDWIKLYEPAPANSSAGRATNSALGAASVASCLTHRGRVYAAPDDAGLILALDGLTGQTLWRREIPAGGAALMGVVGSTLVTGGQSLAGFDIDTGQVRYRWPESSKAGLRGMGMGCIAANEVFWPTRNRLFVFDAQTAAQTRESFDIADLGGAGANVTPAAGCLVVAGTRAMTVLGPINRQQPADTPQLSAIQPTLPQLE